MDTGGSGSGHRRGRRSEPFGVDWGCDRAEEDRERRRPEGI